MKKNVLKLFLIVCTSSISALVFTSATAPIDKPSRPGRPEVTNIKNNQCDIQFEKPQSDGGSRITGYIIEKKNKDFSEWEQAVVATRNHCTVPDLIEGSEMEFRAKASNKAGIGEPSYPSNPVVIRGPFQP